MQVTVPRALLEWLLPRVASAKAKMHRGTPNAANLREYSNGNIFFCTSAMKVPWSAELSDRRISGINAAREMRTPREKIPRHGTTVETAT